MWKETRYYPQIFPHLWSAVKSPHVAVALRVGPFDFGVVTLKALLGGLQPRFRAHLETHDMYRLIWTCVVPCRDTGSLIEVMDCKLALHRELQSIKPEVFIRQYVYDALFGLLHHELKESLVVDGVHFHEPHP